MLNSVMNLFFKRTVSMVLLAMLLNAFPASAQERVEVRKNKKGAAAEWVYRKDGVIYKKEYDRNGDSKPDFRVIENHGRFVRKEYDNNFDGKFEKVEKPLARGSSGIPKTMDTENDNLS